MRPPTAQPPTRPCTRPPAAAGLTLDFEGEPGGTYPLLSAGDGTALSFTLGEAASKQSKAAGDGIGGPALVVSGLQLSQSGSTVEVALTPQPDGSLAMAGALRLDGCMALGRLGMAWACGACSAGRGCGCRHACTPGGLRFHGGAAWLDAAWLALS